MVRLIHFDIFLQLNGHPQTQGTPVETSTNISLFKTQQLITIDIAEFMIVFQIKRKVMEQTMKRTKKRSTLSNLWYGTIHHDIKISGAFSGAFSDIIPWIFLVLFHNILFFS